MSPTARLILSLLLSQLGCAAQHGGDAAVLVQGAARLEKPKPHVHLEKTGVQAEAEVEGEAEERDIDLDQRIAFRSAITSLGKMKTIGNILKFLTGQTHFREIMPVLQEAFNSTNFLDAMHVVSKGILENATEMKRFTDIRCDDVKKNAKVATTDDAVIKILQDFYEEQRQVTMQTAETLTYYTDLLAARLPPKTIEQVRINLHYLSIHTPLNGIAHLLKKFINAKPDNACRELGFILRNTSLTKDGYSETLKAIEMSIGELPIIVRGVVQGEALERATEGVLEFAKALHAMYQNFNHNSDIVLRNIGSITQWRLKCNWKVEGDASM